jgi:hypothetical protein
MTDRPRSLKPKRSTSFLNETYAKRFEKLKEQLEVQYNERVSQEVRRYITENLLPQWKDKLEKADRVLRGAGKPVFTNSEFRRLLAALHPDNKDPDRQREAFELLTREETRLRGVDTPLSSNLPTTAAEWLAARKTTTV